MRPVTDLQRRVAPFQVITDMVPAGDQPTAIAEIYKRVRAGDTNTVLLGATGTGKTASVAWIAERLQRPVLVMLPNKTLAAQFANELREMLPNNAVEYFVSYYDYYQPEAYVPQTDTYIEKDSSINSEVERLRHSATNSLLTRRDTIVVSSVSCIYGLGTPQEYVDRMLKVKLGDTIERDMLLRKLVGMQYTRNDLAFTRGTFRVRGDTIEVIPMYEELAVRIEMFGDEIERLMTLHPLTGEVISEDTELYIFPASHYVAGPERMERAINGIEAELATRLGELERGGKLLEAQRLRMRTTYDVEMMRQVGSCSGIENYSRHIDGREAGSPPNTLLDYFPEDFLLVIDESHVTVPQIGAMYEGDVSRKRVLVEHGFRLPSAIDNRPLTWDEFLDRIGQTIYLSATPGPYELQRVEVAAGGHRIDQNELDLLVRSDDENVAHRLVVGRRALGGIAGRACGQHAVALRHIEVDVANHRVVRRKALRLLNVGRPAGMLFDRVDRETDDLDATLVELRFDLGHVTEFGGADRREVLRVREQHHPRIADPIVEFDLAFRGLRFEIRGRIIDRNSHHTPLSRPRLGLATVIRISAR